MQAGLSLGEVGVVDIAPTIAHILGLDFDAIDGVKDFKELMDKQFILDAYETIMNK